MAQRSRRDAKEDGVSEFRSFGVSEFRSFGVSEFRSFGVSEFRSFGVSEFRSFGVSEGGPIEKTLRLCGFARGLLSLDGGGC
jgi:hypothetical protein